MYFFLVTYQIFLKILTEKMSLDVDLNFKGDSVNGKIFLLSKLTRKRNQKGIERKFVKQ
jgi:hypothetical protein